MAKKPTIIISGGCKKTSKELADRIQVRLQAVGLTSQAGREQAGQGSNFVQVRSRQWVNAQMGRGPRFFADPAGLGVILVGVTNKVCDALHGVAPIFVADTVYLAATETQPDELVGCTGTVAVGRFPSPECQRALT